THRDDKRRIVRSSRCAADRPLPAKNTRPSLFNSLNLKMSRKCSGRRRHHSSTSGCFVENDGKNQANRSARHEVHVTGVGRISKLLSMSLQFHQVVEHLDVWIASSADISFVITFDSPTGRGFRGRQGFVASWRPLHARTGAVKVIGSPFKTFADAETACNHMLRIFAASRAAQANKAAGP